MTMVIATMATAMVIEETTIVIMAMDTTTVGAITRTEGTTKLCKSWNIAMYCFQKKRRWTGITFLKTAYSLSQSYYAKLFSIFTILYRIVIDRYSVTY